MDVDVTEANGFAEREAALTMLDRNPSREQRTVAADKAYDSADFVADCRERGVTPQVAMNISEKRLGDRCAHHTPCRIPGQPEDTQTDRGVLRLGQRRPADAQDEGGGQRQSGVPDHPHGGLLHAAAPGQAPGGPGAGAGVGAVSAWTARRANERRSDKQPPRSKEPEPMRERKMTTQRIMGILSARSSTAC